MSNKKEMSERPQAAKMKRRDAMKLTAAVAAFGSVLGFTGLSASSSVQRLKWERFYLKFWIEGQQNGMYSFQLPNTIVNAIHQKNKILIKLYRNDSQIHTSPFSWG